MVMADMGMGRRWRDDEPRPAAARPQGRPWLKTTAAPKKKPFSKPPRTRPASEAAAGSVLASRDDVASRASAATLAAMADDGQAATTEAPQLPGSAWTSMSAPKRTRTMAAVRRSTSSRRRSGCAMPEEALLVVLVGLRRAK